jgi:hypothetical protein
MYLMNDAGYDIDLDTPDQYAAEDDLYLCSGPLPEENDPAELEAGKPSRW